MKNGWADSRGGSRSVAHAHVLAGRSGLQYHASHRPRRGSWGTGKVAFARADQVVCQIHEAETGGQIMERSLTEYGESYERVHFLMPESVV